MTLVRESFLARTTAGPAVRIRMFDPARTGTLRPVPTFLNYAL